VHFSDYLDIYIHNKYLYAALILTDDQIDNLTLIEIEKLLQANRKSLTDYPCIPFPNDYETAELGNRLIYDELNYDVHQQIQEFHELFKSLTGILLILTLLSMLTNHLSAQTFYNIRHYCC
jgi:hypothetical protein